MSEAHDVLFRTLADPTRRAIFERLCREGEKTVGALTARAGISQPAVSKHLGVLKQAWAEFRDDSFILQFLSPKVMRDFRLFQIHDNTSSSFVEVKAIHDELGYRRVRKVLAEQYDAAARDPDIQVVNADLSGGRRLTLQHRVRRGVLLDKDQCDRTLQHVAHLWGYRVKMLEVDAESGKTLKEHEALPLP